MTSPRARPDSGPVLREGGLYVLGAFGLRAGNLLLLPLYLGRLDPADYGAFGVARSLVHLLVPLVVVAQGHSLLRLGVDIEGDGPAERRLLGSVVAWVLGAGTLGVALTAALWPRLERLIPGVPLWPLGAAAGTAVLGQGLFQVSQAWLRHRRRARAHTALDLLRWGLLAGLLGVTLGPLDLGAGGAMASVALSSLAAAAVSLLAVTRLRRLDVDGPTLRSSLGLGLPLLPHVLATVLFQVSDQVLLAARGADGLRGAGVYLLAAQLASVVHLLAQGIHRAWVPFYLREERAQPEAGWGRVRDLSILGLGAVGGSALVVGLLAPEGVRLAGTFSGGDWSAAGPVVPLLALGGFARGAYLVAFAVVLADRRRARWMAPIALSAAALNVGLNLLWIPRHGLAGAASATLVSWLVAALAAGWLSRRTRAVPFDLGRAALLGAGVAAALMLGPGHGLGPRLLILAASLCGLGLLLRSPLRRALDRGGPPPPSPSVA